MVDLLPSDLLDLKPGAIRGPIATDTETSGLFADDGARVSTASIAFQSIDSPDWADYDNVTAGYEVIAPDIDKVFIVSVAWPFDQGTEGKPEDNGQPKLWPEADNLDHEEWLDLLRLLESHDLVMHNSKFDSEKYRVGVRRWPGVGIELQHKVIWDTQNVNHLIFPHMTDPATGQITTSLKPTCAVLFGKEWADEGAQVKAYLKKAKLPAGRWDLMPWDVIGKYADTDARITLMLMLRQQWEIEENGAGEWLHEKDDIAYLNNFDFFQPVLDKIQRRLDTTQVLYRMERRGVPYPEVDSRESAIEARKRATEVAKTLPFEPTGPAAKAFFFTEGRTRKGVEHLNLVPYAVTDKGAPSLTAEIVERMIDDGVEYAARWGEYSRLSNAASMWYEGYADAVGNDGRIRTAFRQNGTRSSRFSVERINLQAIPQDYRLSDHAALAGIPTPRNLIALAVHLLRGGWRLYEMDLAQAELRVGAMFAKCGKMLSMIEGGEDLHSFTTKALFPQIEFEGPEWGKYRQVGKRGNFSLQFGSGGKTFRKMVSKETGIQLDENESNRIVEDWNGLYPEYRVAITKHMRVVEKRQNLNGHGWVELINGERRWFQPYEEAHKAFNQRVQGNLAQFGIDWMIETDRFLSSNRELAKRAEHDGIGEAGLVLTIHDSQVLLLPDDEFGQDLAQQCAGFANELWKRTFPGVSGYADYHAWDYKEIA